MADTTITIPDLGSLTSGQASDLLLATRGTTGYKMLLSDLAKYMVETYNSSSLAGSAQSVKNALDSLNSRMLIGSTAYTPAITSASPDFTAENIQFWYMRVGGLLFISGRFQITNVGTSPNTEKVAISLPPGFSCNDITGACGDVVAGKNGVDVSQLSIRQSTDYIWIQAGAGGMNALSILGTGYVLVNAFVMLKKN